MYIFDILVNHGFLRQHVTLRVTFIAKLNVKQSKLLTIASGEALGNCCPLSIAGGDRVLPPKFKVTDRHVTNCYTLMYMYQLYLRRCVYIPGHI